MYLFGGVFARSRVLDLRALPHLPRVEPRNRLHAVGYLDFFIQAAQVVAHSECAFAERFGDFAVACAVAQEPQ